VYLARDGIERVPLAAAAGRVAAAPVVAAIDVPPFARSAMDGYAVIAADTVAASKEAPARLRLVDRIFTAQVSTVTVGRGACAEIATGAPLPAGADAVVMVEETARGGGDGAVDVLSVVQSGQNGNSISIVFKEYGIRLYFTPTVLGGDLINLKIKPEVSSLDFNNAIVLDGFRLPALTTRRVDTEVELQDGQTFALAGLMNNTLNSTLQKIPGIGDIPILGALFRSRARTRSKTELIVVVTPEIRTPATNGTPAPLPEMPEPFLPRSSANQAPASGVSKQ